MNINGLSSLDSSYLSPISLKKTTSGSSPDSSFTVGDFSDSVNLSTTHESGETTDRPGIYVGPDGRTNVNINDALTPQAKELLIAATGG